MPVERLSAVTLVTGDMAAAVAFYEVLGFDVVFGGAGAPFTTFDAGGGGFLNLQLVPGRRPSDEVWGRVIFWVDDVDALHDRARAAGIEPATDPADAPWGERYFHVRDPDGHEVSIARLLT